jgi:spore coat polysaccharide biosynthesis predicted glycosyltransferase SpsG
MRIIIRADAGAVPEIGTGHIIRALKLAEALRKTPTFIGSEIIFATRDDPPYELGGELVRRAGYDILEKSNLEPNSRSEQHALLNAKPDMVIFDRLETSEDLIVNLRNSRIVVVTFDDLGAGRNYADLAINPLLQNVTRKPNIFIGYDFLFPLSDRIAIGETSHLASKVFVSFGGFDHRKLNRFFINTIPRIDGPKRYDIVVSGLNSPSLTSLADLAKLTGNQVGVEIVLHERPSDFYALLFASDLAIVSGGLTAFCCAQAGLPAIGIPQYEHQIDNLNRLQEFGCLSVGTRNMELDAEFVSRLMNKLITDQPKRIAMRQAGIKAIDGKGLDRTINLILKAFKSRGTAVFP